MTSETDDLPLAADFAGATSADWRRLVDGVLKGAPFEKLVGKTYDDLAIEPIYPRATGARPVPGRAAASPWQIMQRMDHPDPTKANAQALHDLENGATGLEIEFARGSHARGFGLIDDTAETLKRAFENVVLDAGISIALNPASWHGDNAVVNLAALIAERGIDPNRVDLRFNYQPLSILAATGTGGNAWPSIDQWFVKPIRELMSRGFKGPFVLADGGVVHDAGGSEAQELAFTLASAVAYLRALESDGFDLDGARGAISFRLAADADQFLTIAKFRTLRLLWARIEEACGLAPKPAFIAAESAWRMLTRNDPYVNMLRATIATFSAGLGGANAITVLPHTLALGLPDAFARRVARNTQLILLEESNLAKVADPAAGSGGIEALTQELCAAAWSLFQEIEKAGGVLTALQRGLIQDKVRATCRAREANIARRRDMLTGASEFPNLQEAGVAVDDHTGMASTRHSDALHVIRLAAPFENLRDLSDANLYSRGKRPSVFLANLGTAADFTARATFARSFFEAGGIAAVDSAGFADPAAVAAAYNASGADLVCLCSSDRVYATAALHAATALQAAGARHIYLAGRPGEQEAALRGAGVGEFIFAGTDAPKLLREAYRRMERT
jgi:methylmalonyl-CoA mutase